MELSNDYLTIKLHRLRGVEKTAIERAGPLVSNTEGRGGGLQSRVVAAASWKLGTYWWWTGNRKARFVSGTAVKWFSGASRRNLSICFRCSPGVICLLQNVAEGFKSGRVYPGSGPLAKQCLKLVEEVPAQFSLDHRSHVLRIVSAILTAEFKTMQPKLADFVPMRDHVLQVFERLQTNELLSLSVGELAKKFNCSRRHLNRLFHQHFGLSVASLRMEMRLLKAVSLLVDPRRQSDTCG